MHLPYKWTGMGMDRKGCRRGCWNHQ